MKNAENASAASMEEIRLDVEAPPLENAAQLARIARAVYSGDPVADFPAVGNSFDRIVTLRSERVFGLVVGNSDHVVVAFRGRDDNQQLLESLGYNQTDWVCGRAHGGLVGLLKTVWQQILAAFFDVSAQEKTLWLAGHSLGGSLSMLAAQRLAMEGFDPHAVVTFGSPRTLDPVAAGAFPTPLHRFVNNEDAIPDMPWPTLFDTYAHAGEQVFLLASGDIGESRHSEGLARKIDRANHIGDGIFAAGPVHDHSMNEYLRKMERYRSSD